MPENILVVEYEPRYTDRVRQALAGQPFSPSFAKDGEEALRAIESPPQPRLIVLSSVVPKVSASDLIRAIRNQKSTQDTPILLTVSGYNGKSPKSDAQRMGASDILPKPYSESEFLGKVQQILGVRGDGGVKQFTSNEIFGELLEDDKAPTPGAKKNMAKQSDDLDKMLADTLAGVMPQKKKTETNVPVPAQSQQQNSQAAQTVQIPKIAPPAPAAPPAGSPETARPRTASGNVALDKLMEDTLSGLEKTVRAPKPAPAAPPPAAPKPVPAPAPPPPAPAAEAKPKFSTEKMPAYVPDRMPSSSPIFPAAAPAPAVQEEEEPKDGIKFGQYVLLEKIATGGMAEVWKARMRGVEGFQKIVAIKKILPHLSDNQDFIEMFIDEAKLAAQLNHNNIIHIYDLGKIQNSYYIAMEYVDGYDLKNILKRAQERDQPMQVELALFIASKIAAALDYAHRKRDFEDREMGLVHRDVSPQNVLISDEGDIKLCDFGIAKAASKASHTQAGALKGKLQYMSPEQAWGRHIDKRSDVFALATVLFEMLTARKLFAGDNELSILEQVREARVTKPSEFNDEVTPQIDAVVLKALEKEPEKRYQTAGEMARDLDQILYSFKPTPTSADLAIYMHRLATNEPIAMHEPEPFVEVKPAAIAPVAAPVVAPPVAMPSSFMPAATTAPATPEKKAPIVPIAIAAVVVIAIVIGVLLWMKSKNNAPAATTVQTASAHTKAPIIPTTSSAATTSAATTAPLTATNATATQPAVDTAKVDEEVRKRLDAERMKLEQQQRAQPTPAAAPTRPTPQPVAAAPQPVVATPQPVIPTPQPIAPPPAAVVPAPAPQPAAAETPRAREGDLVPQGTEGLSPARLTRQALPVYPPLARVQRVEGSVLMNVLISETGQVLDAKVISGVNRPVGINEAALQTVRRSSFSPGTKDGVRVKSWTTVRVDFKL